MDLSVLRWPFCGLTLLPLHYSNPDISYHARYSIPYQFTCHEAYYSDRAPHAIFYRNASHLPGQGLEPCLWTFSPTPARWPRVSAKWGSVPESCDILVR